VAALDLPIGYSGEYEENTLPGSRSIYEKVLKGFLR